MSSQIRNFVLAFVIAAVVFSGIAFVAIEIIDTVVLNPGGSNQGQGQTAEPPAPPDVTAEETKEDVYYGTGTTFNFLLIGADYERNGEGEYPPGAIIKPENRHLANTIVLGMFHKERNEFVTVTIPSKTITLVDGVEMTIGEAYHYKGEKYVADKVSTLLGIGVDYYMSVEMSEFASFVDYVGGVNCTVPVDIVYTDPFQQMDFNIQKGKNTLDGKSALAVLRYDKYNNEMQRVSLQGEMFVSVINSITSDYLNKQKYADIYAFFTQSMSTNFTFAVCDANLDLIFKFTSMTKTRLVYPGYWIDKGFVPDTKKGRENFSIYKQN